MGRFLFKNLFLTRNFEDKSPCFHLDCGNAQAVLNKITEAADTNDVMQIADKLMNDDMPDLDLFRVVTSTVTTFSEAENFLLENFHDFIGSLSDQCPDVYGHYVGFGDEVTGPGK